MEDELKQMTMIEGGHLVARALNAHGVGQLFTLCGGTIESIYDGCLDQGIRIVSSSDLLVPCKRPLSVAWSRDKYSCGT